MADEFRELTVPAAASWRAWLTERHADSPGAWLVLAKKGTTEPTRLSYDQALEEALCHGWIDGQVRRRDVANYRQRFTRRRPRGVWSARNVTERLIAEGRMCPPGLAEVDRARADGRWDAGYAGPATAQPHRQNRYAITYRLGQAKRAETSARWLAGYVVMLASGETIYPQRCRQEPAGQRVADRVGDRGGTSVGMARMDHRDG